MTLIDRTRTFLRRTFRGLWRSRDFRKLWLSLTITSFGAQITNLALPLTAALLLNATPMQMGILVALETLPFALVSLHAGVLLDRVRKLPVIIFADVGRGLALLAIPIAAWFGSLSMEILFAVGFLCGVQNVVGGAAYQVLLAQMAGRKRLVEANAKVALGETSAALIGPGLATGEKRNAGKPRIPIPAEPGGNARAKVAAAASPTQSRGNARRKETLLRTRAPRSQSR